jgi:NADH-quinone oxidoreductase subunit N
MILSTPLLWIVLPIIIAGACAVLYQRRLLSLILASFTSLGLAGLGAFFPENLTLSIGPLTMKFSENLGILGRQISLPYEILPFLTFVYVLTGLWILSSTLPGVPTTFHPVSLVMTALLTAALGVEPFLYAALLIETAVLVSIPVLSPIATPTRPGILRYLSLQTLAMPFLLLAGWLLTGVETLPPNSPLIGQTMLVLGLGFALLLGVFPFHSWVPMVSQHAHPLAMSFLSFILPTTILMFALNFLDRYTFLRESENIYQIMQLMGTIMIVSGGAWTAFEKNLKRAFGFSALTETGFSLLAIGLSQTGGLHWLMLLLPARALGFLLWGFTLTLIDELAGSLDTQMIQGFAHRYPILSTGLILAQLSIAGLPLLASFPTKIAIISATFSTNINLGVWGFLGSLGLFFYTIRLIAILVTPEDINNPIAWIVSEKMNEYVPIVIMVIALILLGLFPHIFPSGMTNILTSFGQLQ